MATKINLRSPFYIKAQNTYLASATLKLYIATGDFTQIGTSDLKYTISKSELGSNNYVVFEISELIRDYLDVEFDGNYNSQAVWIRYEFDVINSLGTTLFSEADLLLGVDGYTYFEQGANVQDNLLPDTNKLNSWTKSQSGGVNTIIVFENNDTGIFDGFSDATELEADGTSNVFIAKGFTETGKLTYSVYAKSNGRDYVVLRAPDVSNNNYAFFNVSNGTIGTVLGDDILDARISPYNDYYKCEIDLDIDETGQKTAYIYVADEDNNFNVDSASTTLFVITPRLEKTSAKHKQRDTLLQSNKTIFRLNDHNVRVPVYTRYTTSIAYRYQGVTKRSETISPSESISGQIDYVTASGNDNVDTYQQRVLADGGTLEQSSLLNEFLDTIDIGIVDELYVSSDSGTEIVKIKTFDCSRYEPIKVTFVNKFGALQDFYFVLKSIESTNVKSEQYKRSIFSDATLSYKTYQHQKQLFHTNGNDAITLNTDYIDEENNKVIEELMLSEQTWITRITDEEELIRPVMPKTKSVTYKTSVNDRLVQYTIEFDMAFDKINNIR